MDLQGGGLVAGLPATANTEYVMEKL